MFINYLIYIILLLRSVNYLRGTEIIFCTIPNQFEYGICVNRHSCPQYIELFQHRPFNTERLSFVKQLQCQYDASDQEEKQERFICCPPNNGTYFNPIIRFRTNQRRKYRPSTLTQNDASSYDNILSTRFSTNADRSRNNLLPGPKVCGIQVENRIIGGEIAEIDEFPWTALLIYNSLRENVTEFGCGGVLISDRYVLTAAHCVIGESYEAKGGLKSVRLGEYNTETDIDCIQEDNEYDCAEAPVDSDVEEIIPHPLYNPSDWNKYNDIALLRLTEQIQFNDFIKPICLPRKNFDSETMVGTLLSICGWGKTDLFREHRGFGLSPIKLKLKLPIVDRATCIKAFSKQSLIISDKQICAGGEKQRDSCPGDSGSPLMLHDRESVRWMVTGIVSLGLNECGTAGVPGVYTNVQQYLGWISETVKA